MYTKADYEKAKEVLLQEHQRNMDALNLVFGILGRHEVQPVNEETEKGIINGCINNQRLTIETLKDEIYRLPKEFSFSVLAERIKNRQFAGKESSQIKFLRIKMPELVKSKYISSKQIGNQVIYTKKG